MQDDEEQPIAIAFVNSPGDGICEELVYEDDIFWGTIYRNFNSYTHYPRTHRQLTWRNNLRIEVLLLNYFPLVPESIRLVIAQYIHLHY